MKVETEKNVRVDVRAARDEEFSFQCLTLYYTNIFIFSFFNHHQPPRASNSFLTFPLSHQPARAASRFLPHRFLCRCWMGRVGDFLCYNTKEQLPVVWEAHPLWDWNINMYTHPWDYAKVVCRCCTHTHTLTSHRKKIFFLRNSRKVVFYLKKGWQKFPSQCYVKKYRY